MPDCPISDELASHFRTLIDRTHVYLIAKYLAKYLTCIIFDKSTMEIKISLKTTPKLPLFLRVRVVFAWTLLPSFLESDLYVRVVNIFKFAPSVLAKFHAQFFQNKCPAHVVRLCVTASKQQTITARNDYAVR